MGFIKGTHQKKRSDLSHVLLPVQTGKEHVRIIKSFPFFWGKKLTKFGITNGYSLYNTALEKELKIINTYLISAHLLHGEDIINTKLEPAKLALQALSSALQVYIWPSIDVPTSSRSLVEAISIRTAIISMRHDRMCKRRGIRRWWWQRIIKLSMNTISKVAGMRYPMDNLLLFLLSRCFVDIALQKDNQKNQ